MTLEECLLICRHYESLQWHINTVRPTGGEIKAIDGLARQHPRPKSNTRRPTSRQIKERLYCMWNFTPSWGVPCIIFNCFKCNKQGHYAKQCHSRVQSTTSTPNSNKNSKGSWHGRGRGKGCGSKHAVYEAKTTDASKPIVDATDSEVDIIRLLQAYGMVPTEGSELKHRRKKEATDEICVVQTLDNDSTFEPKPLVLHGSLVECNIDVQWETCDDILPISTYITNHTIPIQVSEPLDWSFDVHLIEIDDVHTDVYTAT